MVYTLPPLHVDATPATSGTAGATTTATIIPAPGPGKRLRILGISAGAGRSMTGLVSAVLGGPTTGTIWRYGNIAVGVPVVPFMFPGPGIQLADNEAFQATMSASVASQTWVLDVYYVIDGVT